MIEYINVQHSAGTWWNPTSVNQGEENHFHRSLVMAVWMWRCGKSLHGTEVWNPIFFSSLLFKGGNILCSDTVRLKNKLIWHIHVREVFTWAWNKYSTDLFPGEESYYGAYSWIPTQGYSSVRPGHPCGSTNTGNGLWIPLDWGLASSYSLYDKGLNSVNPLLHMGPHVWVILCILELLFPPLSLFSYFTALANDCYE